MAVTKEQLLKAIEGLDDNAEVVILYSNGIQVSTVEKVEVDEFDRIVLVESK